MKYIKKGEIRKKGTLASSLGGKKEGRDMEIKL